MAMESTTVNPKNVAGIGCSVITVNRDKDREITSNESGPKFSVKQGEEILGLSLISSEKCYINDEGEMIGPDGIKTGSMMSSKEQARYSGYKKSIHKMQKEQGAER